MKKKGKYVNTASAKRSYVKLVSLTLALVMLIGGAIGGTLAWLTDTTPAVTNTFTTSDINIKLYETKNDFKMVPGWTIEKDPKVSVGAGSEDCWLFVKIEKSEKFDDYIDYKIADKYWKPLQQVDANGKPVVNEKGEPVYVDGVYYQKITNVPADKATMEYQVLGPGESTYDGVTYSWSSSNVLTKPTVTKEMMEDIAAGKVAQPTLTFTAYAAQLYKSNGVEFTASEAWALVNS